MEQVIDWMKGIYGIFMKESRGKKHHYPGIYFDFSVDGEVRVTMKYYLNNIVSKFLEKI